MLFWINIYRCHSCTICKIKCCCCLLVFFLQTSCMLVFRIPCEENQKWRWFYDWKISLVSNIERSYIFMQQWCTGSDEVLMSLNKSLHDGTWIAANTKCKLKKWCILLWSTGFSERLFKQLESSTERFEVKLMMMDLISRLAGIHQVR